MSDLFETDIQEERAQRVKDMLLMRTLDSKFAYPIERHITKSAIVELNLRVMQYVQQFNPYTLKFLIVQTLQDFKREIKLLQKAKVPDFSEPVAIADGKIIVVNTAITKEDFKQGLPMIFITKDELKE